MPEMLFTCRPAGTPIPGRFPGPSHPRGKWHTIDIHCHVRSDKAAALVEGHEEVSRWFLETQASPQSQAVNRANGVRTRAQGNSAEQRIADMDLMGIDIQAITPSPAQTYYGAEPDLGIATARIINDNLADICAKHPERFVGLGTVPFQAPELAVLDELQDELLERHRIEVHVFPQALELQALLVDHGRARVDRTDVLMGGLGIHRDEHPYVAAAGDETVLRGADREPGRQSLDVRGEQVLAAHGNPHAEDGLHQQAVGAGRAGSIDIRQLQGKIVHACA